MTYSPYGKHTYGVQDKAIAAMLANEKVPDEVKDRHVEAMRAEIQQSWTDGTRERHARTPEGVETRSIYTHNFRGGLPHWRARD